METPKISVLMPTYNTQESHLREAIESVLSQTYTDFEFIILDDHSQDVDIEKIVRSYSDERIIFAKNDTNLGISKSRNKLIEMSRGEYLAVMDHDDVSVPNRFMKQKDFLEHHPNVGVVGGLADIVGTGKLWMSFPKNNIEQGLLIECCICHPSAMIRKSVLTDGGVWYDCKYTPSEDYALWCNLIGKTKFHNIQEVMLHYRVHRDNVTHRQLNRMKDVMLIIQNETRQKFPVLWELAKFNARKIRRIKLFSVLPFLKIVEHKKEIKYYLFGRILIMKMIIKVSPNLD
ncbi:MAG: glycosyltransferase [Holosporaceae bacterium]|nr:glycosyltransferase [Holosporaceae bacterium]